MWNFLRIKCNLTSFQRLRVFAAQEPLAPLLARALFLGCTVMEHVTAAAKVFRNCVGMTSVS